MENDEPEKKRRHLNSASSDMAKDSSAFPDNRSVDAAILQCQNQKLVQQLDAQKHELHNLEDSIRELKEQQASYDDILIAVNQLWNQLVGDLVLLGVRAGRGQDALHIVDCIDHSQGSVPSCPAEDIFLCRLLEVDSIKCNSNDGIAKCVEEALSLRHSSTHDLMKLLEDTIDAQRAKTESMGQVLQGELSAEEARISIYKIDDLMKEEANRLHEVINLLHSKHKEYTDRIQTYLNNKSVDQAEIKRLTGELEENMAELEESRRKLINLKMQKDLASGVQSLDPCATNGSLSPEKPSDRAMGLKELKDAIEEAEELAANRLSQMEDAQEDILNLSRQLQDLQNEMKDDKYIQSSRPYTLLNDQYQHWNADADRYKTLTDSLQADRSHGIRREKELEIKAESVEAARNAIDVAESRIQELELKLQKCMIEKNDLEIKMEETVQDLGRKDIKGEFHVMGSALSKEVGMMESQLNRWKETAHEALSLQEKADSLKALLMTKEAEEKSLADKCDTQMAEIKSLKALIENLQNEKMELQIFLDMCGQEKFDSRDVNEIKESERKAHVQAEVLRNALDEHSLELRVKAANEAEAACQQRLCVADAEISELRAKLDASERDVLVVTEAIKIKDAEAESYITEIETIGQAYEDMQTQHQHLLQQVTERDDYNIKLVSESVKAKQAQSFLLSEKQALAKQLQQVKASLECFRTRITHSEEQMKTYLTQAIKSSEEDRHLAVNLETAKWELTDTEKELKWLKSSVASSEKEHEHIQRKVHDVEIKLESERTEKKKLEEELMELNGEIAEMSSQIGEAAIQKLQDDIKDCKAILKCGVCFDRPKEVVIVKCYHLFCNPCIQRNLGIRHRKCPGCGTAFGQSDVRFVNI